MNNFDCDWFDCKECEEIDSECEYCEQDRLTLEHEMLLLGEL